MEEKTFSKRDFKASIYEMLKYAKPCISEKRIELFKGLLQRRRYDEVVAKMLGDMALKTRVGYKFVEDSYLLNELKKSGVSDEFMHVVASGLPFDRYREPARIMVSDAVPLYGTDSFNKHIFRMEIGETMKYESAESFIALLAHEFSHIFLYAIRHPLRESEVATDLCAIALGYGDVIRIGRLLCSDSILGYLDSEQFKMAYRKLHQPTTIIGKARQLFSII
ncbi:MAG TPA: hypothetical protein VF817_00885 [Patescibacteria group bacterium]